MFSPRLLLTSAAASGALAISSPAGASAQGKIIGGSPGTSPSIVQLSFAQDGGVYGCTGEAIAAQWVLTARHCTEGDEWLDVYYSNDTENPGTPIAADRVYNSPYGDVGLVHLSQARSVDYQEISGDYSPLTGDVGTIWGYGLRAAGQPADHLYTASVRVLGSSTDAYGGPAVHVEGVSGAANHGDSGGPLLVDGAVVAVCSTGDEADPGSNAQARSNYANLAASRAWISSIAGV